MLNIHRSQKEREEPLTEKQLEDRLTIAHNIVAEGYRNALRLQRTGHETLKDTGQDRCSLVTEADTLNERLMIEAIRLNFPNDGVFGEEGGHSFRGDSGFTWVLDPVDGTENYARGIFPWAVSASVFYEGVPVVSAVVVDGDSYITHARMPGVLKNSMPLRPIRTRDPKEWMISYERFDWLRDDFRLLKKILEKVHANRSLSSAIGQCMYVIDGRLEAMVHPAITIFDIASPALLVEKAGARVSRWNGSAPFPSAWEVVTHSPEEYMKRQNRFDYIVAPTNVYEVLQPLLQSHAGMLE